MKLLLDPHLVMGPRRHARLGKRVRRELQERNNELWLSPVSTWEALMLNAKGRTRLHEDSALQ